VIGNIKMKIFNKDAKINFVDKNNVFLGYDMGQCCCENADWFISDTPKEYSQINDCNEDLEGYVFDTSFFKEVTGRDFDSGGMVIFRIVNGESEKFIHIFNSHNGYYCHGFLFTDNGKYIQNGSL
jgi:hypothetical protein